MKSGKKLNAWRRKTARLENTNEPEGRRQGLGHGKVYRGPHCHICWQKQPLFLIISCMLSAPALDFGHGDDYWSHDDTDYWLHSDDYRSFPKPYRAASVVSWGVTSIGRGFDWTQSDKSVHGNQAEDIPHIPNMKIQSNLPVVQSRSLPPSIVSSPLLPRPPFAFPSPLSSSRSLPSQSPSSPRSRRRSSQQRVSLIAGRVSIAPIETPSPPPMLLQSLKRVNSSGSLFGTSTSTRAPSPSEERSFLGERSISEFLVQGDIGRGAYGLVKRGREIYDDGSLGVSLLLLSPSIESLKRSDDSRLW